MAIGLEIEINLPIDRLTTANVTYIQNAVQNLPAPTATQNAQQIQSAQASMLKGYCEENGKVGYGILARHTHFRIDADHDDRVRSPSQAWPPREGGVDSIVEIVTLPATDARELDTKLDAVQTWIEGVNTHTNNLTTRWSGTPPTGLTAPVGTAGAGTVVSVGPLDYGAPVRQPNHGYTGSVQVNVGIDIRAYHSYIKWYADSDYAKPSRAPQAERTLYQDIVAHIKQAVNVGRTATMDIMGRLDQTQKGNCGNCLGLRGFLTHMALYFIRGATASGLGGTRKNLAPILMKSPNTIIAQYGFTDSEIDYYNVNRNNIVRDLLRRCGRHVPAGTALNTVPVFTTRPLADGGMNVDTFSDLMSTEVPLTGAPIRNRTGVGRRRHGNAAVRAIATVAAGAGIIGNTGDFSRGGVVIELRTLPGYYDGVASWRRLGQEFLAEAELRNDRSGIATT